MRGIGDGNQFTAIDSDHEVDSFRARVKGVFGEPIFQYEAFTTFMEELSAQSTK